MHTFAWIIWGLTCTLAIALFLSLVGILGPRGCCPVNISKKYTYIPQTPVSLMVLNAIVSGIFLAIIVAALVITLIGNLSKLHLLWFVPVLMIVHNRVVKPMVCRFYMIHFKRKIISSEEQQ